MRGGLRAGSYVRSGPSGSPPVGLRAWETANAAPGSLVRPSGSVFHDRVTGKAYLRTGAPGAYNWTDLAQVGNVCNLWYTPVLRAASRALSIADGNDPSVVGLVATVGSVCQNNGQTLAWLKYGTGNYDWRSLNETRASVTAAGGPLSALDLTVAVAAGQSAVFEGDCISTGGDANLVLRVNGGAATVVGSTTVGSVQTWTGALAVASANQVCRFSVRIGKAINGWRQIEGVGAHSATWFYNIRFCGLVQVGALTSIGVSHAGGLHLENGSVLSASVGDFHGVMP